ncbi:hypothetical protein DICPUDRAFT_74019 [Dictyostelium purpureum]|uniref:Uncharacterized protein n=1 Tax=Dictyostelium purpureum TaxID=5786 RepID=F0Z6J0_DICPU|nr:uncharacterized protein DICPUDRAFT_74019 [Dictyostelium purpureum]EGC40499.1 hypothetical protein DICPUDRAFT_74019 [Dictyostelium purpureum]|eukprot:XP_003283046.1 hypothetical protein DICPUDRAFT_74019 [Dictyostelium purpureum]
MDNKKRNQLDCDNNNNENNNNENNNNEITYETFKKEFKNENRSDYRKLRALSKELNLGSSGGKKVIYNRLESYLKAKKDLLDENQFKSNINPFNKKLPRLEITNCDEKNTINNGELAFWNVFRNKTIFKLIFSNFKFSQLFNYDSLVGTKYIFNNFSNAREIIKDKLKSKSYFIRNNVEAALIIGKLKKENREFYIHFFSTYPLYCKNIDDFRDPRIWLRHIIECGNIPAFHAYTSLFKQNQRSITTIFREKNEKDLDLAKVYRMQVYLETIGIKLNNVSLYDTIQTFEYTKGFKSLIKLFNTVIQKHTPTEKQNLIIHQLNGPIDLNQFNKTQLNLSIEDISLQNIQVLKQKIHKILKFLYSISKSNHSDQKNPFYKPIQYYLFFKEQSKAKLINNKRINNIPNNKLNTSNHFYLETSVFNKLTLYFQNTDSCIDFQKQIIDFELAQTETIGAVNQKLINLQRSLISTGNMVLIDYLFSKNNFECFESHSIKETLPIIKKEEVFNYFYERIELINMDNNPLWPYVSKKSIEKYENLMKGASKKFIFPLNAHYSTNLKLKNVLRALNNPSLYKVETIAKYIIDLYSYLGFHSGEQELHISILEKLFSYSNQTTLILSFDIAQQHSAQKTYKFFHWLFKDLSDQDIIDSAEKISILIKKSCVNPSNNQIYEIQLSIQNWQIFLLKCGRFDAYFKVFNSKAYNILLRYEDIANCPLMLLDHFLGSDNTENNNFITTLLKRSAKKGMISVFKAILIKKPTLLKINHTSICNIDDLKEIVTISIENGNAELTHFLLQHINFSKKDLDSFKDREITKM